MTWLLMVLLIVVAVLGPAIVVSLLLRDWQKRRQFLLDGTNLATARLHRQVDALLSALDLPPDGTLPREVLNLIEQGQEIEAIAQYRKITGSGLKESKESLEAGSGLASLERKLTRVLRELDIQEAAGSAVRPVRDAPAALDELEFLVRQGKIIEAVKQYRDAHGGTLTEARRAVEAVELYLEQR